MVETAVKSPETIREEILSQILSDNRIGRPNNIQVTVANGVATLAGTVRSTGDKRAAEQDAVTSPGIARVENLLRVNEPDRTEAPTDESVATEIRDLLVSGARVNGNRIQVTSSAGFVTLEGAVHAFEQKRRSEELAAAVNGVVAVDNKLAVVPTDLPRDRGIAREIVLAIDRNNNLDINLIDVKVERGIVTLEGQVPDVTAYVEAGDIASSMDGVKTVRNNLQAARIQ